MPTVATFNFLYLGKLMRLGSPNRIVDDLDSKEIYIVVELSSIRIPTIWSNRRYRIRYKIDLFSIKIDLLIELNQSNVNYLIKNGWFISKIDRIMVKYEPKLLKLPIFGQIWPIFDQIRPIFDQIQSKIWIRTEISNRICRDE